MFRNEDVRHGHFNQQLVGCFRFGGSAVDSWDRNRFKLSERISLPTLRTIERYPLEFLGELPARVPPSRAVRLS
jgi:hypothetical protein